MAISKIQLQIVKSEERSEEKIFRNNFVRPVTCQIKFNGLNSINKGSPVCVEFALSDDITFVIDLRKFESVAEAELLNKIMLLTVNNFVKIDKNKES